jgi:3-hydroxyacyl-CoA dehydrogenase/enoyl-CoA hydratase/3-hydroxybutyryl-CoA epimerase
LVEPKLKTGDKDMGQNIQRTTIESGIAVLTFDRPESSANIFDQTTFDELNEHLNALSGDSTMRGLIIRSAKPKIFIAGADLHSFTKDLTAEKLSFLIDQGQKTFDRIAALPFPTVAAIHGVAVGGGFEIALACDYRIASLDSATKVGLPETMLGILPAWGGCTRLPRLVGLPTALDAILSGKQFAAKPARELGMVDEIAYPERLMQLGVRFITESRGKKRRLRLNLTNRSPMSGLVAAQAKKKVLARTRGHYPAPLKALEVVVAGLTATHAQSLENERRAFVELAAGEIAQNLIRIFFLQERSKKLSIQTDQPIGKINRVLVVGAGLMGSGIAQWLSARGRRVILKDIGPEPLGKGLQSIHRIYRDAVKRRIFSETEAQAGIDRILPTYEDIPLRDIDLVIEAAVERLDLKQLIFREVAEKAPACQTLASNTSALSIDAIATGLPDPGKVLGMHFFNPVHRMQLLEIVEGPKTSSSALATAVQFAKSIGKLPVLVKDSPGFLVNRILLPYMMEAFNLFAEGLRPERIDRVMLDFGMPMGPLRLTDEVGLDVSLHVGKDLVQRVKNLPLLNNTIERMIAQGWLGRKSGRGFYIYAAGTEHPNPALHSYQAASEPADVDDATLRDRLILVMVNEAARCLAEKVVTDPADVDFAMIMGTGWAPFRGGPLRYADSIGISNLVTRLRALSEKGGDYFAPSSLLVEMAGLRSQFYPASAAQPASASPSEFQSAPA